MVAAILCRVFILLFGTLYPAYASFKAIRTKSHRDYTKWMMYWVVFAIFQAVETFMDVFVSWMPLYYELKIVFVLWLVLPLTEGAKQLYRVAVHPFLMQREAQIDAGISKLGSTGLDALRRVSKEGLSFAATAVVTTAMRGQVAITEVLQRSSDNNNQIPVVQGANVGGVAGPAASTVDARRPSQGEHISGADGFTIIDSPVQAKQDFISTHYQYDHKQQ
ncbi:hypothetical protein EMCRGX_G028854 [Ephydatia muelleri]|eukprot:Em0013g994a